MNCALRDNVKMLNKGCIKVAAQLKMFVFFSTTKKKRMLIVRNIIKTCWNKFNKKNGDIQTCWTYIYSLTFNLNNIDILNNYNSNDHIMYLFYRWRSSALGRTGWQREYRFEIVAKIGRNGWEIVERAGFQMASRRTENVEASRKTHRTKNLLRQLATWVVFTESRLVLCINYKPMILENLYLFCYAILLFLYIWN